MPGMRQDAHCRRVKSAVAVLLSEVRRQGGAQQEGPICGGRQDVRGVREGVPVRFRWGAPHLLTAPRKYCSERCSRQPVTIRSCATCGKTMRLKAQAIRQRHCSLACRGVPVTKRCAQCDAEFSVPSTMVDLRRCCSRQCEGAWRRAQTRTAEPPPPIHGATWIPLAYGRFALVDKADEARVVEHAWYPREVNGTWYAFNTVLGSMHRFILGDPPGKEADHRNMNGLDNRRRNLRAASKAQQRQNQLKPRVFRGRTPTSTFKGVSWNATRKRWEAGISHNGHRINLGRFDDERAAACAYDESARIRFGEFARLNFPRPGEQSAHHAASF